MNKHINKRTSWLLFLFGVGVLLFLFLLPVIPVRPAGAQLPTADTYKELDDNIQTFFKSLVSSGNTARAFENLLLQSPLGTSSAVTDIRTKLDETKKLVGEFQAYEPYLKKSIGKDIVQIKYILKGEYYPVIWTFTFYRKPSPQGSADNQLGPWQLIEMRFDSTLDV
jgi:hypothetical protein